MQSDRVNDPGVGGEPLTVAVLGSCITRDSFNTRFNPGYKQWYRTVLMQNQSSLISVMSPPSEIAEDQLHRASDYDLWNVRTDFSKQFLGELGELAPDYLILDFFGDIHFGVLELADGRYVTNNRWKLWPTPYYKALKSAGPLTELRLERDTEAYLELWKDAFDRLVTHVRTVSPATTVVVHRGHNTGTLRLADTGKVVSLQRAKNLARIDLPRSNELWRQLDDYASGSTGFPSIDLTARDYPTFEAHPWGAYYVHYSMDYYADFLTALNRLHLRRVLCAGSADEAAMLDQVLEHGGEQAAEAARRQDAVIKGLRTKVLKQQQRIEQLQRRTPEVVGRKVLGYLRRP